MSEQQMALWQGLDPHGHSIVTVIADSPAAAKEAVRYQLARPGRYGYLKTWEQGGEQVKCLGLPY